MYDLFAERLAKANEFIAATSAMIDQFLANHGEQSLRAELANRIYMFMSNLHAILFTEILGDEPCNLEMDAVYNQHVVSVRFRVQVRKMRIQLITATMNLFRIASMEDQLLTGGRVSLPSLALLAVAALARIERDLDPEAEKKRSFTRDFACARRYALQATEEQLVTPIQDLSVHAVMNALHAIYVATPISPYSKQFEQYTALVLNRALDLLTSPGAADVWNIHAYREQIKHTNDDALPYRYSAKFLRDTTLVWGSLSEHFDLANLLPMCDDPHSVCAPTHGHVRLAREWLFRNVVSEVDTWVRDNLVALSMRAGEMEMYHAEHRAEHSTPHLVLRDHRVSDYYMLMERAPMPSRHVLRLDLIGDEEFEREGFRKQPERLHASLVVLSTFKARLKAAEKNLDPDAYVVMSYELRQWSPYLNRHHDRPILVLLYNHVQLWFGGKLLMYNSALEAVCAWMILVDTRCKRRVDKRSVDDLLTDFLRPTESGDDRTARLAAQSSTEPPRLGNGGVF